MIRTSERRFKFIRTLARALRALRGDARGGVSLYSAALSVVAIGVGAFSIDYGRMAVLQMQLQDAADAGAMAAAVQLDGRAGARARALEIANNATAQTSGLAADGPELTVSAVNFYSAVSPAMVAATGDSDSQFVEVIMAPRRLNFLFKPVLNALFAAGSTADDDRAELSASAIAGASPFICNAPPLMICDLAEHDPDDDLRLPANVGRQVRLKEPQAGGGPWEPGNFGLLALPDGSSGADDIEGALAAVEPANCYSIDVITATGSKTNKTKDGINARFDLPGNPWPYPAPNVINFPRDDEIVDDPEKTVGKGEWDLDGYWLAKHGSLPPGSLDDASRYQTYLYELGLEFARKGRQTLYPVPDILPDGYAIVTPPPASVPVAADPANADDPDYDGVPSQAVAANQHARRLIKVAQLQCLADDIHGHGTYPTSGNYVEMFITETVKDPPDAAIYAEVVRALSPINSPEFHANVRVVK